MITVFVKFALLPSQNPESIADDFKNISEMFCNMPGLIRKYFVIADDASCAGGVYLWESRAAADGFYTDNFRLIIEERYGAVPEITYFDCPVVIDNQFSYELQSTAA